jgi:hypothetical protein
MKLGELLFYPSFFCEKTAKLVLFSRCISIGKRATGLPLGGLDKDMSQHYSAQDQAQSLLHAEARFETNIKKDEKSILFVSAYGTTGCDLRLPIRLYVNKRLMTWYLEIYLL